MIRRGGGRSPPVILIALLVTLLILGFNYWLLSSQNADLQQEVEKLQAEVKISAMKQEQSEKKNAALQETVHEMDSIAEKLKKKVEEGEDVLKTKIQDNQKKEYEITTLKNKIINLQEEINTVKQQVEDQEMELAKAKETNTHLVSERDAAVEAVAEKDMQINNLKRQLEQEKTRLNTLQYAMGDLKKKVTQTFGDLSDCQDQLSELEEKVKEAQDKKAQEEVAAHQREQLAVAQPKPVPGNMNLPGMENKGPQEPPAGLGVAPKPASEVKLLHQDTHKAPLQPPVVQQLSPNIVPQQYQILAKPRYSLAPPLHLLPQPHLSPIQGPAVMERPAPPVAANQVLLPVPGNVGHQEAHNEVLAPPPPQDGNLMGNKYMQNLFEPNKRKEVGEKKEEARGIDRPGLEHGKAPVAAKEGGADRIHIPAEVPMEHNQLEMDDRNDAQEQLDDLPQPQGQVGLDNDDHNNAQEQVDEEHPGNA